MVGGGVQSTCNVRETDVVWCNALDSSRYPDAQVHQQQKAMCVMQIACAERTDALSSLTSPESQDISLDSAHNTVQEQTVN